MDTVFSLYTDHYLLINHIKYVFKTNDLKIQYRMSTTIDILYNYITFASILFNSVFALHYMYVD